MTKQEIPIMNKVGELLDTAQKELLTGSAGSKITNAKDDEISTRAELTGTGIFDKIAVDDDDVFKLFARLCVLTMCFKQMQDALSRKIDESENLKNKLVEKYSMKLKEEREQAKNG